MTRVKLKTIALAAFIGFAAFSMLAAQSYAQDTVPAKTDAAADAAARKEAKKKAKKQAASEVASQPASSASAPASRPKRPRQFAWVDPDTTTPPGTQYRTFHSTTINGDVSYLIYLPPDYAKQTEQRYPAIYWLHGSGANQRKGGGMAQRLDQAIREDKAQPMIIVLINGLAGETMYCDTRDGKWPLESVIVKDLVPHIDATYRTIARRDARGVEGFSMGGFGAAHFGFKYPEVFGVVSILAPALLGPDIPGEALQRKWSDLFSSALGNDLNTFEANNPFDLVVKNAEQLRGRSVIRIVPHDTPENWLIPRCEKLHALLDENGIKNDLIVCANVQQHNYGLLYDMLGEKGIGFFANAFPKDESKAGTAVAPAAIEDRKAAKRAARGAKAGRKQGTSSPQPASDPTAGEEPSSRQTTDKGNWVDPVKTAPYGTQYKTCFSKTINGEYSYLIYLPPDYETARDKRYPVIYWLHGGGGNQRTGDYFIKSYSEAMKAGKAREAILILVNGVGGSFFCDSKDGKKPVETAIIHDLIPHVDATYRTYGTRAMRAIEGFSMGGFGALHLAMKFPETFCSVTALAHAPIRPDSGWPKIDNVYKNGPLQGDVNYFNLNDPFQLADRNVEKIKGGMTMRFIVGTSDNPNTQARTKEFYEKTQKLGITSTLTIVPGVGHAYVNLYDVIGNSFEYYTKIFARKP